MPLMIRISPLLLALALPACATIPDAPIVSNGPAQPAGTLVGLGQPVGAADIVLTPMRVTEDSRCPMNARCVWAGRIVVETRVDGAGWRETVPLTLGEPESVRGYIVNLITAEPGQMAGEDPVAPEEYRFGYEASPPDRPAE